MYSLLVNRANQNVVQNVITGGEITVPLAGVVTLPYPSIITFAPGPDRGYPVWVSVKNDVSGGTAGNLIVGTSNGSGSPPGTAVAGYQLEPGESVKIPYTGIFTASPVTSLPWPDPAATSEIMISHAGGGSPSAPVRVFIGWGVVL
jgi:hypothetical protein